MAYKGLKRNFILSFIFISPVLEQQSYPIILLITTKTLPLYTR